MKRGPSSRLVAGIDVSAKELCVAVLHSKGERTSRTVPNTPQGHKEVAKLLAGKRVTSRVVLEPTASFHLDLAITLASAPGIEVMLVNPRAARCFAQAQMRRAKTDRVDADVLLEFALSMPFTTWTPPRAVVLELRAVTRHLGTLVADRVAMTNRISAARATRATPAFVLADLVAMEQALLERIDAAEAEALRIVATDDVLVARQAALVTVPGIADRAAVLLMGELGVLDPSMTPDEVVASAGLDPRPFQSGARDPGRRISKVGNARLRAIMHMPAMTAVRWSPAVSEWHKALEARGIKGLKALTAVARRLLRVIWVIHRQTTPWDDDLFRPRSKRACITPRVQLASIHA